MTFPLSNGSCFSHSSQSCTPCPPGYQCSKTDSNAMKICPDGSYSKGSQQECTECPAGYACPSKTDDFKVQCYPGTYTLGKAQVNYEGSSPYGDLCIRCNDYINCMNYQ